MEEGTEPGTSRKAGRVPGWNTLQSTRHRFPSHIISQSTTSQFQLLPAEHPSSQRYRKQPWPCTITHVSVRETPETMRLWADKRYYLKETIHSQKFAKCALAKSLQDSLDSLVYGTFRCPIVRILGDHEFRLVVAVAHHTH